MSLVIVVIKINAKYRQLHACIQVPAASIQIELVLRKLLQENSCYLARSLVMTCLVYYPTGVFLI